MAFYLLSTPGGQFVREGVSIGRMRLAAAHAFPEGVLEVKKLSGASGLATLERNGVALSQAALSALAKRRAAQRSAAAWSRRQKAGEARQEARQAAAAEKERLKLEAVAAKRREAARLNRVEKKAAVKVAEKAPAVVLSVELEGDAWDGDAAPWD